LALQQSSLISTHIKRGVLCSCVAQFSQLHTLAVAAAAAAVVRVLGGKNDSQELSFVGCAASAFSQLHRAVAHFWSAQIAAVSKQQQRQQQQQQLWFFFLHAFIHKQPAPFL
jgi:hypothetical protein